jgi:hypothetical protein
VLSRCHALTPYFDKNWENSFIFTDYHTKVASSAYTHIDRDTNSGPLNIQVSGSTTNLNLTMEAGRSWKIRRDHVPQPTERSWNRIASMVCLPPNQLSYSRPRKLQNIEKPAHGHRQSWSILFFDAMTAEESAAFCRRVERMGYRVL